MSIKLHNILLEGERESAWKEVVDTIKHRSSTISGVFNNFTTGGLIDKDNIVTNSKTFVLTQLKKEYFNRITTDGSGGKEYALEVSKFIIKEVRRVVNDLGVWVLLPFNDKDVDKGMKDVDMDYIYSELEYFFNIGTIFTDNNIEPFIDKGSRFDKDFITTFNSLTPRITQEISKTIKSRV